MVYLEVKMNKRINNMGFLIQIVLVFLTLIFLIISFLDNKFYIVLKSLMIFDMFVLAYNNQKIYKRKYMTIIYIIFAIIVFASIING